MIRSAYATTVPYLREWLAYQVWRHRLPGMQVAVGFDGELLLSDAWGYADVAAGRRLTTTDVFRIASHSKTFTATALLRLAEQGRVRLDDPVAGHVPELRAAVSPIADATLRELLEHGGGVIRDGADSDHWQLRAPFPDRERLLALVRADGSAKAPAGEGFHYSNLGFGLLGLVIERVTGSSYGDHVRQAIIEPLGLAHTAPDADPDDPRDRVTGYSSLATARERRALGDPTTGALASATGFVSTAEDLVSYFSAHVLGRGDLLTDHTKRRAQRRSWSADEDDPSARGYATGLIADRIGDREIRGHSGGFPGHTTQTMFDPRSSLVVSVLVNATAAPATPIARGLVRLLDLAWDPSGRPVPAEETVAAQEAVSAGGVVLGGLPTGRFAADWGVTDIARVGDRLLAIDPAADDPADRPVRIAVEGADLMRAVHGDRFGSIGEPIPVLRDADGGVRAIRMGGMELAGWTIPEESPADAGSVAV